MKILETERLIIREIVEGDAEFILDLLNQPSFVRYIGDRNFRTVAEAKDFIENRYRQSYREHGFGLYSVELKAKFRALSDARASTSSENASIGICGFVKRDDLPDADIGFAFLPQFCGKGYAFESAEAVIRYGREKLNLKRVLAITSRDNESSEKLLEKINFKFERLIKLPHDERELKLFLSEI